VFFIVLSKNQKEKNYIIFPFEKKKKKMSGKKRDLAEEDNRIFTSNSADMFEDHDQSTDSEADEPQKKTRVSKNKSAQAQHNYSESEGESENNHHTDGDDSSSEEDDVSNVQENIDTNNEASNIVSSDKDWRTIYVTHRWVGSLKDFSTDAKKSYSQITENNKKMFAAVETNSNATDTKSGKKDINASSTQKKSHNSHILKDIRIVKSSSNFPTTLNMHVVGLDLEDQNHFSSSGSGSPAVCTIYPREVMLQQDKKIVEGNHLSSNSRFLKDYPNWNAENLSTDIKEIDANVTLVKVGHPVLEFSKTLEKKRGGRSISSPITGGWHEMPTQYVNVCLDEIKTKLEKNLKIKDLSKIRFKLSRAFVSSEASHNDGSAWTDTTELEDVSSDGLTNVMNTKRAMYATFAITFKNV
jgi:hypothetical protein